MAAVLDAPGRRGAWLEWLPVGAAVLLLYVPVFYQLATTLWRTDDNAQGPIILAVTVWLAWRERGALGASPGRTAPLLGLAILILGLLLYVLGRSQGIGSLEVGALLPILAGALLSLRGPAGLRGFWFPLLFIVFLVPLPATFVDALTGPLKAHVSAGAEHLLYAAGYPVARSGVVLDIGQYRLLVADACSGLNSMFSLSALGLLYLYLVHRRSWLHNALVIATILPIAFAANVVRVVVLALVTYYLGDAAGQGFLHAAAGLVLVMIALAIIFLLDALLALVLTRRAKA